MTDWGMMTDYRTELRAQFCQQISDYSERRWSAGWMENIEEDVRLVGGMWLAMAWWCAGWPKGYRGENGWEPLTKDELAEVASWSQWRERDA